MSLVGLEDREVEDPKLELQITVIAPPAMLALAIVFQLLVPTLRRIFLRSLLMTLVLAGGIAYLMVLARRAGKPLFLALGAAVLLLLAIATFGIRERTAQMLITFGGYGMGMVLGAALMADRGAIPFGQNEGGGLSDPLALVETYGWSTKALVQRYVMLAVATMAAFAAVYAWAVQRARRHAKEG